MKVTVSDDLSEEEYKELIQQCKGFYSKRPVTFFFLNSKRTKQACFRPEAPKVLYSLKQQTGHLFYMVYRVMVVSKKGNLNLSTKPLTNGLLWQAHIDLILFRKLIVQDCHLISLSSFFRLLSAVKDAF